MKLPVRLRLAPPELPYLQSRFQFQINNLDRNIAGGENQPRGPRSGGMQYIPGASVRTGILFYERFDGGSMRMIVILVVIRVVMVMEAAWQMVMAGFFSGVTVHEPMGVAVFVLVQMFMGDITMRMGMGM